MNTLKINHLAVWVSIILAHLLGFVWYGVLFMKPWMEFTGVTAESAEANSPETSLWILNAVAIIAPIYLMAWLFSKLGIVSGVKGAGIGFLLAFCFHHLPLMNSNMFAGEPYPLAWITGGYVVAYAIIAGFILGAWTKRTT
jgi:hypothetical protein